MAKTLSYKIAEDLYLTRQPVGVKSGKKVSPGNVHHHIIVDVSGSMHYDLPKIREHIKAKILRTLRDGDLLSITAFSGKGQCYPVLTAVACSTLADYGNVSTLVDRWIRSVGATGFVDPIRDIARVHGASSLPLSVFFLTDGGENCSPPQDVLNAIADSASRVAAATVVSYGYYADTPFLTKMAERWGGNLILSQSFSDCSPKLDAALTRRIDSSVKVEVPLGGEPVGDFIFSIANGELVTHSVDNDMLTSSVPDGTKEVCYLTRIPYGEKMGDLSVFVQKKTQKEAIKALYAAISLFSIRMKPAIVLPLLKASGDVKLINEFSKLFGRQRYAEFQETTKDFVFNDKLRLQEGFDPTAVPRSDAFTVMELLQLLESDPGNRLFLNAEDGFEYNRIGRKTVDANLRLTKEEAEEFATLQARLANEKNAKTLAEISLRMAELSNKPEPLKFVESEESKKAGYSALKLVYNEDRPNVSILVKREGHVDLTTSLSHCRVEETGGVLPFNFPTYIFRNYTIVKDGLVNVKTLPCKLTLETYRKLGEAIKAGRLAPSVLATLDPAAELITTTIALDQLPIVNREAVSEPSAKALFLTQWELLKAQGTRKAFKDLLKALPKLSQPKQEGFVAQYSQQGADWLEARGITEYKGFNPKVRVEDPTDCYLAKVLEVKVKGFSSLPSLADYQKQLDKPIEKRTPSSKLFNRAIDMVAQFQALDEYKKASGDTQLRMYAEYLQHMIDAYEQKCRTLLLSLARQKAAILVGGVWFSDLVVGETKMQLNVHYDLADGGPGDEITLDCEAVLREVEEKI